MAKRNCGQGPAMLLLLLAGLTAAHALNATNTTNKVTKPTSGPRKEFAGVQDYLETRPDMSTISAALDQSQIIQSDSTNGTVLSYNGSTHLYKVYLPCNMFLPTNKGFASINISNTTDIPTLSEFLTYSMYGSDISNLAVGKHTLTMMNGQTVELKKSKKAMTLIDSTGNASTIAPTSAAAGGCIVFTVDRVLQPQMAYPIATAQTPLLELLQDNNVGIWTRNAIAAGLGPILNQSSTPYTVIPAIDASAGTYLPAYPDVTYPNGTYPVSYYYNALASHIVVGYYSPEDLHDGMILTSVINSTLQVNFTVNPGFITLVVLRNGNVAVLTKTGIDVGASTIWESDDDLDPNYYDLFYNTPTPCAWAGNNVTGGCLASNDFLLAIPNKQIYTDFGRVHKEYTMKELECEGQLTEKQCRATSLCIWNYAGTCTRNTLRDYQTGACKGSHAAAYYDCRVTYQYKAGCESNQKCAWNTVLSNGTSLMQSCFPKKIAAMNTTEYAAWQNDVLFNFDPTVFFGYWGNCTSSRTWYPAISYRMLCPTYTSESVCHINQCIWGGASCTSDNSRFLGFLLAGSGVMQEQAMQCANPFRSTLGIQACYAYELLDTRAKGHIL